MPKELEAKLKREGEKKGFTGDRLDAYVYGTLRKTGWKPNREKRTKYQRSK
jgi:hypothetical protein